MLGGFAAIGWQLSAIGREPGAPSRLMNASNQVQHARSRPDLMDRNGRMLASDIRVYWLNADPSHVLNADDMVEKLSRVLRPDDMAGLRDKLVSKSRFEWIKRGLTPKQAKAIHNLGLPGLSLLEEPQRIYTAGRIAAHILGHTDVDNAGIAGIEKFLDARPELAAAPEGKGERAALSLSLDLRVQHALHEELTAARARYQAKAVNGVVLDVHSGEILAMAGLPDYDPNDRGQLVLNDRHNRLYFDSYELGSVFKSFTIAMVLENGIVRLEDQIDVLTPIRMGKFTLRERHSKKRYLSVAEVFTHSSNTGAARLALSAGGEKLKGFFAQLGLLEPMETELGRTARPLIPDPWREVNTMTAAYGHGISVSPFAFAVASASLINGGYQITPRFLPVAPGKNLEGKRIISAEISGIMRHLFWDNVENGTGRKVDAREYRVGGKTGTAYKPEAGGYSNEVITSFVAGFPMDNPQYLVLITIDEPQPEKPRARTEAGHNAAPTAGLLIKRIAPMLGVAPSRKFDENRQASY
jgi:cell division protein FtsI (penicillin-binding protein 3)